jgi:hypothetical protein
MSYSEEVTHYKRRIMFKNHKLELRIKKDANNGELDTTPSITKEDIVHIATKVGKVVIGGVLVVLASAAALDTAKYGAMTAIEDRSARKKSED